MKPQRLAETIPDDRVAAILTRAAELDRGGFDLDTIRTAAIEAGISPAAVDQAIQEFATGTRPIPAVPAAEPLPVGGRWRRRLHKLANALKIGALGWVLGLVSGADGAIILGWLGLVAYAVWLAVRSRPRRQSAIFQLKVALMTVGMFIGYAAVGSDEDVLAVLLVTGVGLLMGGTAAIHLGLRQEQVSEEAEARAR